MMVLQKLNRRCRNVDEVSWFCKWFKGTVTRKPCILVYNKCRFVVKLFIFFPFRKNKGIVGGQLKKIIRSLSCFKWNQVGIWKKKKDTQKSFMCHNKLKSLWCNILLSVAWAMKTGNGLINENALNLLRKYNDIWILES